MTSMRGDIVNRVKRLPKPSLAAEALQPVFEAVSNSLHAVEDAFGDQYQQQGKTLSRSPILVRRMTSKLPSMTMALVLSRLDLRRFAPPTRIIKSRVVVKA